jgi:hypothetical protein
MRANGVPSFPDPNPGGGFEFNASAGVISSPAFRAAQAKCQRLMPAGGPLNTSGGLSEQALQQLRKIAICMRALDLQSPAYVQAAAACGAAFLGRRH